MIASCLFIVSLYIFPLFFPYSFCPLLVSFYYSMLGSIVKKIFQLQSMLFKPALPALSRLSSSRQKTMERSTSSSAISFEKKKMSVSATGTNCSLTSSTSPGTSKSASSVMGSPVRSMTWADSPDSGRTSVPHGSL